MVLCRINGVDSDDVRLQLREEGNVSSTASNIGQRILKVDICTRGTVASNILLVCNALDEEFGAVRFVEKLGALSSCGSQRVFGTRAREAI